jgi:hypothetical protein
LLLLLLRQPGLTGLAQLLRDIQVDLLTHSVAKAMAVLSQIECRAACLNGSGTKAHLVARGCAE